MKKRVCLECGKPHYSANEGAEYWRCQWCGAKLPFEIQEGLNGQAEKENT